MEEKVKKKILTAAILSALMIGQISLFAQNAENKTATSESKEWKSQISEKDWLSDKAISIKDGAFGFVDNPEKKYGWIESKEKFPFSQNAEFCIDFKSIKGCSVTLQLQIFNENKKFIGAVEILKDLKESGIKNITFQSITVDPKTAFVNFKIWMKSGNQGANVEIKELIYKY